MVVVDVVVVVVVVVDVVVVVALVVALVVVVEVKVVAGAVEVSGSRTGHVEQFHRGDYNYGKAVGVQD